MLDSRSRSHARLLSEALTTLYAGGLAQFCGETIGELIAFLKTVVRNRAIDVLKERSSGESAGGFRR